MPHKTGEIAVTLPYLFSRVAIQKILSLPKVTLLMTYAFQEEDAFTALTRISGIIDRLYKASGTQHHPARSCADLVMFRPELADGEYYIDPNGGHWRDSFLVHCQTKSMTTAIKPINAASRVRYMDVRKEPKQFWYAATAFKHPDAVCVMLHPLTNTK